ncbi:leucine-rich repeat-containing protein 59-like [Macrobrachium rosenbergii]|uniref:leucine-rich repeat-containing protein 59-like n=1 Tax=Macrobrachium rosenbergii TaxID=79674 RepID=UPI0034D575DE
MKKIGLKNKLEGDELDLSMLNLTEVPVSEIASLPKATKIDLSSNQIVSLPQDFAPRLAHITRLELGSNKLRSLPDNIDQLTNLRHLDLYNNQLTDLPVGLCQLRNLRWLDLKGNPLNSGLKKAAGDCLNQKECELAARRVVAYLKRFHIQMENEKLERVKKEKEKEAARQRAEEEQQAKKRAERKAAKEKRKQEHKAFMESQKHQANGSAAAEQKYVAMPKAAPSVSKNKKNKSKKGGSWLGWLNVLLFLCLVGATGYGLYVYTDGDLSPDGIKAAYPRIVENAQVLANLTVEAFQPDNLKETVQTVSQVIRDTSFTAWAKLEEYTGDLSMYTGPVVAAMARAWVWTQEITIWIYNWLVENIDWNSIIGALSSAWRFIYDQWLVLCAELSKNKTFMSGVEAIKGYSVSVWENLGYIWVALCHQLSVAVEYVQEEGPGILASVKDQATSTLYSAKQSIEGLIK